MKQKFKIDKDFPLQFCLICGSDDIGGSGGYDYLVGKERWNKHCNNCEWEYEVFILKEGKKKPKFRFDMKDCPTCQKEQE